MKNLKKLMVIILMVIMIVVAMPATSYASDVAITDLPNDWSREGLLKAMENGLLTGYNGKIMPKDFLTRAQMAAILNKAFGATQKGSLVNYKDVKNTKWYYDDMAKALEMNTFVGYDNLMQPENFVTREQVFVVIAKVMDLSDAEFSSLSLFKDASNVSPWARPLLASMTENKYMFGAYGFINPKKFMTRAEFAALMNNLIKNYITVAGTYTEDYEGSLMVTAGGTILKDLIINGDLIIGDGVGDGEVTLDNVIVKGRTIVRGKAQLVELDLGDEAVALGAGGVPGPNPGSGNNPGTGPVNPPPNTSEYGFILVKGTTRVLLDDVRLRDNDKVNFQLVSIVYNNSKDQFIPILEGKTAFIERALAKNSARSGESYAFTFAKRVLSYDDKPSLRVFGASNFVTLCNAIIANGNATAAQINDLVRIALLSSLDDVISDFEKLYPNDDDYVPADFTISTYNGTTLVPQSTLLIRDIRKTMDSVYNDYKISTLDGKQVMKVRFGDDEVYMEIIKY